MNISDNMDTLFFKTSTIRGLYITGEAGNSKSYEVYKYLQEKNIKYKLVTARVSNLALYMLLYKHRKDVLVFDDVYFDRTISTDLIKGALNDKGVVNWLTTSDRLTDEVPPEFEFKGKIIIITNDGIKESNKFYPLLSRMYVLEKNLTLEMYKVIADKMCVDRGVSIDKILPFISPLLKHRDLRNINKAIDHILAGNENLIAELFKVDEELEYIHNLKEIGLDNKQIKVSWCDMFNKSHRTFFRVLKRYNLLVP
jgi:hypothetical protein